MLARLSLLPWPKPSPSPQAKRRGEGGSVRSTETGEENSSASIAGEEQRTHPAIQSVTKLMFDPITYGATETLVLQLLLQLTYIDSFFSQLNVPVVLLE
jgi:hypothetical protein